MKKIASAIFTAVLLLTNIPLTSAFVDVKPDNIFSDYIDYLIDKKVFSTENEDFRPEEKMNRYEFAKAIVVAGNIDINTNCSQKFQDIPEDSVFFSFVQTLLCNNLLDVRDDFFGFHIITRGEAAKLLVKVFDFPLIEDDSQDFKDIGKDNEFFKYAKAAKIAGFIMGYEDGNFYPYKHILREEAAKMIALASGYKEYGDAVKLELNTSQEQVSVGSSVTLMATPVDKDGKVVRDYTGTVTFSSTGGELKNLKVEMKNGVATTSLSSKFAATIGVQAKINNFSSLEKKVIFALAQDDMMMLYAADKNLGPNAATTVFLMILNEDGLPLSGASSDITFKNTGSGTLGNIVEVPSVKGVYAITYTANVISETDTVTATNNVTGQSTSIDMYVAQSHIEPVLLNQAVSVNQDTVFLVKLFDKDGAPLTGATLGGQGSIGMDLSARVLNDKLGTIGDPSNLVDDPVEAGGGVYAFTFRSKELESKATIELRYDSTPVVLEYFDIDIYPYDIDIYTYPKVTNTVNGDVTVILTVKDVNGNPVSVAPESDFDFSVYTPATVRDPSGDEIWNTVADWVSDTINGIYVTQIHLDKSTIDDSTVVISIYDKTTVNNETLTTDVFGAMDPKIYTAAYFQQTYLTPANDDILMVQVKDAMGNGIEGLEDDGTTNSYFRLNNQLNILPTINVESVGGGLYILASDQGGTTISSVTLVNNDIARVTGITPKSVTTDTEFVYYGDTSVPETTGDTASQARSGVAVVGLDATSALVDQSGGGAELGRIQAVGTGVDTTIVEGNANEITVSGLSNFVSVANISALAVDQFEVGSITIETDNTYIANLHNKTFTVYPIQLDIIENDSNKDSLFRRTAVLIPLDREGNIITDTMDESQVTFDLKENASDGDIDILDATQADELEFGNVLNTNVMRFVWFRTSWDGTVGPASIEWSVDSDDDNMTLQPFKLVNYTFDVFTTSSKVIAARENTPPTFNTLAPTVGIPRESYVFAISRDDNNMPVDVNSAAVTIPATTDQETQVIMEISSGKGFMMAEYLEQATPPPPKPPLLTVDDIEYLGRNLIAVNANNVPVIEAVYDNKIVYNGALIAVEGLYAARFVPENDPGVSTVQIYSHYDDRDYATIDIETLDPSAQIVQFPESTYPSGRNDTAYVIATIHDQFGNSIQNLNTTNEHFLIEIDGDDRFNSTLYNNEIYIAEFITDDPGTYPIQVKYNDRIIGTDEVMVNIKK